jgi:thioredoxin-like negative regulator of GroEL
LLGVLRVNKHFGKDRGKLVFLGLLDLLDPESKEVDNYRKELASTLF